MLNISERPKYPNLLLDVSSPIFDSLTRPSPPSLCLPQPPSASPPSCPHTSRSSSTNSLWPGQDGGAQKIKAPLARYMLAHTFCKPDVETTSVEAASGVRVPVSSPTAARCAHTSLGLGASDRYSLPRCLLRTKSKSSHCIGWRKLVFFRTRLFSYTWHTKNFMCNAYINRIVTCLLTRVPPVFNSRALPFSL
jgi:hypothetical protein